MKIATWNVNSIVARRAHVLEWLQQQQPDVLCLQELKCVAEKFPLAEMQALGYDAAIFGQPTYNGVAILSRLPLEDIRKGFPHDDETAQRRLISARIAGCQIINVYIPNGGEVGSEKYVYKLAWLAQLRQVLAQQFDATQPTLICGDFNVAPEDRDIHDPILWYGQTLCTEPERAALGELANWGFRDLFRQHQQERGHYSWWDYRGGGFARNLGLRIDHIWATAPLALRCTSCLIDRVPRAWERPSDHAPVIADFAA